MGFQDTIAELINRKETFLLSYVDGKGLHKDWTIRYAQIGLYEGKPYLEAWCEESQPSDLPELEHNACFRFDRIVMVKKDGGAWREPGLGLVEVRVAFYGDLAIARAREIANESIELLLKVGGNGLVETLQVSNLFWLFRRILQYGDSAEILKPKEVRTKMREKLTLTLARYDVRPTK